MTPGAARPTFDPRVDAADTLVRVLSGKVTSTEATNMVLRAYGGTPRSRGADASLFHELVMGVLRRRLALVRAVEPLLHRPLKQDRPRVRELLLCMAYQALFLERVPAHAWVSASVDAARRIGGASAARLVNAVGRALARSVSGGDPLAAMDPPTLYSAPALVLECMRGVLGREPTGRELAGLALDAPSAYRAASCDRGRVIERLAELGVRAAPTPHSRHGVIVEDWAGVARDAVIPSLLVPQDEASQLVAEALDPQPGDVVVDLCAGLGIKLGQLMAQVPSAITVGLDLNPARLRRAARLSMGTGHGAPPLIAADARKAPLAPGSADKVLVDAPCTGLGTLVRRPEVRYTRRRADVRAASRLQREILDAAVDLVRPGGRVIYAVCSFCPDEGPAVVDAVLGSRDDAAIEPIDLDAPFVRPDGTMLTLPWRDGMDGFFAAMIRRSG